MKRLYLVRHAKSSWKNSSIDDHERPLSDRGKKDAPFMGKKLRKQHVQPDLMITSPAKRALTTAQKMAKELGYQRDRIQMIPEIYSASVSELVQVIQNLDDQTEQVLLVGHNPTLTELTGYLTSNPVNKIPTGGVFCIDFPVNTWKEISERIGNFVFFDYPKKYTQ